MDALDVKWRSFFLLLALLPTGGSAIAQHMNSGDAACKGAGSNAEVTACFASELKAADAQMNAVLIQIQKVLEPKDEKNLQSAQRLWMQFRNANCAAERDLYEGGSAAPMVYLACVAADTRQRASELNMMYGWRVQKFGR